MVSSHSYVPETVMLLFISLAGLMINKYDKSGTVCASFPCSYAWVPPIETGGAYPIESMVVSCTKLEEPHVFCYQLKEGDDFHQLSSLFGSCIATLLLVNTENSFQIDSKLLPQAGDKWPVPVLFIKYMDGVTLLKPHDHEGSTEVRVVKITTPEPWNDNVEQESSMLSNNCVLIHKELNLWGCFLQVISTKNKTRVKRVYYTPSVEKCSHLTVQKLHLKIRISSPRSCQSLFGLSKRYVNCSFIHFCNG